MSAKKSPRTDKFSAPVRQRKRLAFEVLDARLALSVSGLAVEPQVLPVLATGPYFQQAQTDYDAILLDQHEGHYDGAHQTSFGKAYDAWPGASWQAPAVSAMSHGNDWAPSVTLAPAAVMATDYKGSGGGASSNSGYDNRYVVLSPVAPGYWLITIVTIPDSSWLAPRGSAPPAANSGSTIIDRTASSIGAGALASVAPPDRGGYVSVQIGLNGPSRPPGVDPAGPTGGHDYLSPVGGLAFRSLGISTLNLSLPSATTSSDGRRDPQGGGNLTPASPQVGSDADGGLIELIPSLRTAPKPAAGQGPSGRMLVPKRLRSPDDAEASDGIGSQWNDADAWDDAPADEAGESSQSGKSSVRRAAESDRPDNRPDHAALEQLAGGEGGLIELDGAIAGTAPATRGPAQPTWPLNGKAIEMEAALAVVQAFDLASDPAAAEVTPMPAPAAGAAAETLPTSAERTAIDDAAENEQAAQTPLRGMVWLAAVPLVFERLGRKLRGKATDLPYQE